MNLPISTAECCRFVDEGIRRSEVVRSLGRVMCSATTSLRQALALGISEPSVAGLWLRVPRAAFTSMVGVAELACRLVLAPAIGGCHVVSALAVNREAKPRARARITWSR